MIVCLCAGKMQLVDDDGDGCLSFTVDLPLAVCRFFLAGDDSEEGPILFLCLNHCVYVSFFVLQNGLLNDAVEMVQIHLRMNLKMKSCFNKNFPVGDADCLRRL